jgi:hypothetical protein
MPNPSPDENQPEHDSKATRLAQDITDLQKEIRQDFDQRIFDLTNIMARFKSLMINDVRSQTQQSSASNALPPAQPLDNIQAQPGENRQIPILTRKVSVQPKAEAPEQSKLARPIHHRARFETGLYRLNSQLQRFRLELDQELEFRQQPLHVHFRQPSELAKTLQQLSLNNGDPDEGSDESGS